MPLITAPPLRVTRKERTELERLSRSPSLPHRVVVQASALLLAVQGMPNEAIARECSTTSDTVRRWRAKFQDGRVAAVGTIAPGRGRKPSLPEGTIAEVVRITMNELPDDGTTQWSTRSLAALLGISHDTVARIWKDHGLQPWKMERFKVSTDPDFEAKLVDVVGLYMDPPERAVVFSFDEKTQVQALDRTQPSLPMKRGRGATMTHDYKRHGTTDLFAAMDVATGQVLYDTKDRHASSDVVSFFRFIDLHVEKGLGIHVVLDNLSAHKSQVVNEWLAHPKRARWHLHFTPTSSSWLNLVESWFAQLTNRRLRNGAFTSVAQLEEAIGIWAEGWNEDPKPFVWKKNADDIIRKVKRGRRTLTISASDH